ncbi:PREDICTED: uncharacterized protein LOC108619704 [Drosophila arizonae]|uniref:Uncharacterized protein LOC108619704 n=1 Tax=Drosophila arizonae TaxID=7263 RepID=A0ABM1PXI9_DROAR|nr:PREDICTED: uncharacterized protein LOC108619704 [Drosophila arizonae]XP_017871926.1 PREDICTED: uncharacterized protein LOC108619704 [Drosophila arizonae]
MEDFDIDLDFNFVQLSRQQLLQRYTSAVRQLRRLADVNYGVRPLSFDNYVIFQYFQQRSSQPLYNTSTPLVAYLRLEVLHHFLDRRRKILCWLFYLTLISLCVVAYRYETTSSHGGHNGRMVQSLVYPGMRMWRRMTMPLIQRFPRLTELYDESCLMGNPFFQVEDLSCSPCANVDSVWMETDECAQLYADINQNPGNRSQPESGPLSQYKQLTLMQHCRRPMEHMPYTFRSNQHTFDLSDFYQIYAKNLKIFQRDAYRVHSTNQGVHNLEDLFGQFNASSAAHNDHDDPNDNEDDHQQEQRQHQQHRHHHDNFLHLSTAHNLWRCNRMLPARLLRPIFARPLRLPSMSVALERYVAIDTAQAPAYTLPDTECPNVYVHQAVGTRFIILRPTSECRQRCRTLSMRLSQSFVLNYNWLYWKPISAPDPISESMSISLIGSYC